MPRPQEHVPDSCPWPAPARGILYLPRSELVHYLVYSYKICKLHEVRDFFETVFCTDALTCAQAPRAVADRRELRHVY